MPKTARRLRNLGALAHFEAAGRHRSFTRAAHELNVTQGAVSRQIRALEDALGTALFLRLHRAIELTPEGRRFHRAVTMALDHVAGAAEEIAAAPARPQVTIAATLAVSTFWLMPRLGRLRAAFPDLDVQVLATDAELESLGDRYDVGIRYGLARGGGVRGAWLGPGELFPVCSPGYLRGRPRPREPADLKDEALLHRDDDHADWVDWPVWFAEHGVSGPFPKPALRVNSYPLLVQAAVDGQGIALGWRYLVDDLVRSATLVVPLEARLETGRGFWVVTRAAMTDDPRARDLGDWLEAEFAADSSPALADSG